MKHTPTSSRHTAVFICLLLAAITNASAVSPQTPAADLPVQTMVTPAALATNTVVELETVDPLSSNTSKTGDFFHLKVSAPVYLDGVVMIPAGTQVVGQVVHAAKSGMGGKAGELILAARYIDMPPKRVKLHAAFGSAGQSRSSASMVATVAIGVIGLAIHGKQVNLPAGTPISARLAERFTPESSSDASLNPQQSTNPGTTHE